MKRSSKTPIRSRRLLLPALVVIGVVAQTGACTSDPEPLDLTSLRRSAESTFICIGPDGQGAPLNLCSQGERTNELALTVGQSGYELYSLVTQTLSAEVAVIKVTGTDSNGNSTSGVLDADVSNPGITPLRIGGQPTGIASTPGGFASFVGVGEVGLEGIYALPTTCLFAPPVDEPARDITSWPACSLSSAPGDMIVLVDEAKSADGSLRTWCSSPPDPELPWAEPGGDCSVDLSLEGVPEGRRKLLVALPSEGKLVVLDAQEILDRERGTYGPCHVEAELLLAATVPEALVQVLPDDLSTEDDGTLFTYDQLGGTYTAWPAGMDERDGLLLMADRTSPVVHRVDVRDPCELDELPHLFATSLLEPKRVVTTSRVALSPKTQTGGQFAYVVDETGNDLSSVLIFDLSEGKGGNTPLVRSESPILPLEAPDRIEFSASAKDVAFAYVDRPIASPSTGIAVTGTLCDPDPAATGSLASEYRPTSDERGAGPNTIRGLFGYVLLGNGSVALVDIEDFDAPCRRPVTANKSDEPDFRGCSSDKLSGSYFTADGLKDSAPSVTNEVSCRAVVPHRSRSRVLIETVESGVVNAPSLRAFGQLSQDGSGMAVSRLSPEGRRNPIMLGVDFEAPSGAPLEPAQVYVGNQLWKSGDPIDPLVIDPNLAEKSSAVLPYFAPRAYPPDEVLSVIFEGTLDRAHITGLLFDPVGEEAEAIARFEDPNNSFCAQGVQDRAVTEQIGSEQFELTSGALERFVNRHTDYLQITNYLLDEEDPHWKQAGASCGEDSQFVDDTGFVLCDSIFRKGDADDLAPSRDLTIVEAYRDHLELAPRVDGGRTAEEHLALVNCCFPQTLEYRIRGGNQWVVKGSRTGLEHAIVPEGGERGGACVLDDSPIKSRLRNRAFEVSSIACDQTDPEQEGACGVGLRTTEDVVCAYDATLGPLRPGSVSSECIFDGITRRFVVYRGLSPSERDMSFGFEVIGGFQGDAISLTLGSQIVLPVSIQYLPAFGALGVVDSQNRGLMMIDVANSSVAWSFY
jgi:hypothetical protein